MPITKDGRYHGNKLPAGLQMITFSLERDDDLRFQKRIWINVRKNSTIAQIAARRGHPEDAQLIKRENKVRSINYILWKPYPKSTPRKKRKRKQYRKLKVPGEMKASFSFSVMAGEDPPKVTAGYAKFTTIDRPERVGLMSFDGYDPAELTIPIHFEAKTAAAARDVEDDIDLLERMAGRGNFEGAAVGPPPIIRISTTDGEGNVVPLVPRNYQTSPQNKSAPLWRVVNIEWDDGALRGTGGNRRRQLATVTVRQHVKLQLATRSATARNKAAKSAFERAQRKARAAERAAVKKAKARAR
jgi:hypothetical protein